MASGDNRSPAKAARMLDEHFSMEWQSLLRSYEHPDTRAGELVDGLLRYVRQEKAHCPGTLRALDQWETRHDHYDTLRDAVLPKAHLSIGELWQQLLHCVVASVSAGFMRLTHRPTKKAATVNGPTLTVA